MCVEGFGDRLLSEMKKQTPRDIKIRVSVAYLTTKVIIKVFYDRYQHLRKDFTLHGWGEEYRDSNLVVSIR